MAKIAFGTSGLRGMASDFAARPVAAYVCAFLDHVAAKPGADVFVGCDLRASSPAISGHVMSAIAAHGQVPRWCGVLPTPALAAAALAVTAPAIMVTGSHIPEDQNGIKFYRPDGELLKEDEAPMRAIADRLLADAAAMPEDAASSAYVARFANAFGPEALHGLTLGVYEHSAAGRDLLAAIAEGLGANIVRFGRTDRFVAVDTEAVDPKVLALVSAEIARNRLDAVISTDGDGDRPLLIGGDGRQVNGDVLCALAARALGIRTVVTPLTSTSAVELSGWFDSVVRTRIGSPYVVKAMQSAGGAFAGFEANGGFLLGSPVDLPAGRLDALPTRDAVLPLVAVLAEANRRGLSVADLVAELPARVMKADRLKDIPQSLSAEFLSTVAASSEFRASIMPELAQPAASDATDGVRFTLRNGSIIHFRASGNAPELRAYVETGDAGTTEQTLSHVMARMAQILSAWPTQKVD